MPTAQDILDTLEFGNNQLSEEDRNEIQQYHNGRALKQLVMMPGWTVLTDAFHEHRKNAVDELLSINPGDKDLVLAAHAVAYAVHKTLGNLEIEVHRAITLSEQLPEILRERLKKPDLQEEQF
jgi:hypothetical protein